VKYHYLRVDVHAQTEEKSVDSKHSFNEKLNRVLDHFPKYHVKILLGDFDAKLEREDSFKPTIQNASLHQDSNDNGVRIVTLPHQKISRALCSRTESLKSTPGPHLMGRLKTRLITYS